jgi:hypothetical protein
MSVGDEYVPVDAAGIGEVWFASVEEVGAGGVEGRLPNVVQD